MSETARISRGPAAPRLYKLGPATAASGVPTIRTQTERPRITTKSFRLPSSGVEVSQERMASFASLVADATGRISAADRAQVPEKMTEFAQAMLDFHLREVREVQQRAEARLGQVWRDEQDKAARDFHTDKEVGGKRAAATLEAAKRAIDAYGERHGQHHAKGLREALSRTGAGNDRHVIRYIAATGRGR